MARYDCCQFFLENNKIDFTVRNRNLLNLALVVCVLVHTHYSLSSLFLLASFYVPCSWHVSTYVFSAQLTENESTIFLSCAWRVTFMSHWHLFANHIDKTISSMLATEATLPELGKLAFSIPNSFIGFYFSSLCKQWFGLNRITGKGCYKFCSTCHIFSFSILAGILTTHFHKLTMLNRRGKRNCSVGMPFHYMT